MKAAVEGASVATAVFDLADFKSADLAAAKILAAAEEVTHAPAASLIAGPVDCLLALTLPLVRSHIPSRSLSHNLSHSISHFISLFPLPLSHSLPLPHLLALALALLLPLAPSRSLYLSLSITVLPPHPLSPLRPPLHRPAPPCEVSCSTRACGLLHAASRRMGSRRASKSATSPTSCWHSR